MTSESLSSMAMGPTACFRGFCADKRISVERRVFMNRAGRGAEGRHLALRCMVAYSCARGKSLWYRVRHVQIEVRPCEELRLLEQRTAEALIRRVGRVWSVECRVEPNRWEGELKKGRACVDWIVSWQPTRPGTGGLTSEEHDRAKHATVHHTFQLAQVIAQDTCDFCRVGAIH